MRTKRATKSQARYCVCCIDAHILLVIYGVIEPLIGLLTCIISTDFELCRQILKLWYHVNSEQFYF